MENYRLGEDICRTCDKRLVSRTYKKYRKLTNKNTVKVEHDQRT